MRHHWLATVIACALPSATLAQTTDSTVFRSGQWGAEFGIGGGFAVLGALRFSSPRRAMLVDLLAGYDHFAADYAGETGSGEDVNLRLRVGTRAYHTIRPRLFRLLTVGVSGNYRWQQATNQDTLRTTGQGFGAGLFGDLGAIWLVTPNLALGAKWGLSFDYSHSRTSLSSGSGSSDTFAIMIGSVALVGQLYF